MGKTPNRNTKPIKSPKETPVVKTFREDVYMDMKSMTLCPVSDGYLQILATEWITVAKSNDDMLTLEEFYIMKDVSESTVQGWMKRSPELKAAHDHVMMIIAVRREKGMLKKELDSSGTQRSLTSYSPRWKAMKEWEIQMASKVAMAGNGNILVEMQAFPNSDAVPKKRLEKDDNA